MCVITTVAKRNTCLPVLLHYCVGELLVRRCSLPLFCNNIPCYTYFLACTGQDDLLPLYVLVHENTYFLNMSSMFSLIKIITYRFCIDYVNNTISFNKTQHLMHPKCCYGNFLPPHLANTEQHGPCTTSRSLPLLLRCAPAMPPKLLPAEHFGLTQSF